MDFIPGKGVFGQTLIKERIDAARIILKGRGENDEGIGRLQPG